jgi:phage terminase large subunit GpA-like protein
MSTAPDLTDECIAALDLCDRELWAMFAPPPQITVTQWAEQNRVIPPGASARPGPWVTESYQREIHGLHHRPARLGASRCARATQTWLV